MCLKSVLFICHGNICRSPMAEFIFKDMVRKAGLVIVGAEEMPHRQALRPGVAEMQTGTYESFRIDSAAVSYEEEGNDIYPPAKQTLSGHGIPFGKHSAHRVTDAEASEYDVIVIMDSSNRRLLSRIISPKNMSKVHLMMEYTGKNSDVSDPWYTGDFEKTYRDITEGCAGLLRFLTKSE